jgi:histidine ammonia-lyase|tara:strand:+ start:1122 stop:2648 length:1527 start_codon:yes stop_codon:yes gene_type:complete
MSTLRITTKTFTFKDFSPLLDGPLKIVLDKDIPKRVKNSYSQLLTILASGKTVYGVNTGFGKFSNIKIDEVDQEKLQLNLVRSHSAGVGDFLDAGIVRVAMALKVLTYSHGHSGVHPETVKKLVQFLNNDLVPAVPQKGSVGASGDLAQLAHIASSIIGEGQIIRGEKAISSKTILNKMKISPLVLHQKDGISLVNGTQFSTAIAVKTLANGFNILDAADSIGALSVETSLASRNTFKSAIHKLKKHKGQIICAKNIWKMTNGSEIVSSHKNCDVVQDPYSFRCIPHIHGACRDALIQSSDTINNEINSVSDNPVILSNGEIGFSGHFHAEHVAIALDHMAIAIAEIGAVSERRMHYFMKGAEGKFQPFLAKNPGIESGYMIAHVTASALASENKTLAHPASIDSLPTSGGQEDHVSMAPWAGFKLLKIQKNVLSILAIELLIAGASFSLYHSKLKPGKGTSLLLKNIRNIINAKSGDRSLTDEINKLKDIIEDGRIFKTLKSKGFLE